MKSLLNVENLNTRIFTKKTVVNVACDIDLTIGAGEIFGIIGESGCGKTLSMLSLTKLIPPSAQITSGHIYLNGEAIELNNEKYLQKVRGSQISYIFQDPSASLNPLFSVGQQIQEVFLTHKKMNKNNSKKESLKLLELVGLKPEKIYYDYYPHQLSGGMNQRAMIAMAIASKPKLLIADEPTSSLDRITELKILNLLLDLNKKFGLTIILITHNISLIQDFAHRVAIMYAGRIVETGLKNEVINNPKHPYTKALLECIPQNRSKEKLLNTIKGNVPNLSQLPKGCKFHPRCQYVMDKCLKDEPTFTNLKGEHSVKCYLW